MAVGIAFPRPARAIPADLFWRNKATEALRLSSNPLPPFWQNEAIGRAAVIRGIAFEDDKSEGDAEP